MAVEILIAAVQGPVLGVGMPGAMKDDADLAASPWGTREGLPSWVRLRITDASKSQVEHFLDNWRNEFTFDLVASNVFGRRYQIGVNPAVVQVFGADAGVKQAMRDYIVSNYNATLIAFDQSQVSATFDIPNPVGQTWPEFLQQARASILDAFEQQVSTNRYRFSDADVALAVAAGGSMELTTAQALARIIDRLA